MMQDAINKLADGVTVEEIIAQYFDNEAIHEPPYRAYRMDNRGQRWYYRLKDDGSPEFYLSVTSLCKMTLPTPKQLTDWVANLGVDEARRVSEMKANYGTLMHKLCGELAIARTIDLEAIDEEVFKFAIKKGIAFNDVRSWPDELRRDVMAFAKFMIDTGLTPIAIEVVLVHPDGYAGAIDLVCMMNIQEKGHNGEVYKTGPNAGQPKETMITKRVLAIVDLKSGKKGFYESNEVQLRAYREMWNHQYPDQPVEKVYNWAPAEWRIEPSYKLKDQTNAPSGMKWPFLVGIAQGIRASRDASALMVSGVIRLEKGISRNYKTVTLDEMVSVKKEVLNVR